MAKRVDPEKSTTPRKGKARGYSRPSGNKKESHKAPISAMGEALGTIGLSYRFLPSRGRFLVDVESKTGKSYVVNFSIEDQRVIAAAVVVEAERIPGGAKGRLYEILLSQQPEGHCHYALDQSGNITIRVVVPTNVVSPQVMFRVVDELRSDITHFDEHLRPKCPLIIGAVVLFPARLHPPHDGHIRTIISLLEADLNVLAHPGNQEDKELLQNIEKLIISLGPESREKGNPLTVAERTDLMNYEIENNADLTKHKHRLDLIESPNEHYWLPALFSRLTRRPDAIVTANTATIQAARDQSMRVLEIHREEGNISATQVRKAILAGNPEELKGLLTPHIRKRCLQRKLFETIRNIEGSR